MLEKIFSRYVYEKSLQTLHGMRRSARPPQPPAGGRPRSLYLHIPFCEELCGYCTFNRERFEPGLARRYFAALRGEIAMYRDRGYTFDSLYIGGGTPTVLPEELVRTLDLVRSFWDPAVISVETHPDHLTGPLCALMADAGVNRLSVGVQSFQPRVLVGLDRGGKRIASEEARARLARSIGRIKTINVDMIFHVPGQTTRELKGDIRAIKELLPDQVTFYPLMNVRPSGAPPVVPPRRMYELIVDGLSDLYRMSSCWSFSRADESTIDEYITQTDDYAGLGSGSFGYIDGLFYANTFSIPEYIRAVGRGEFPIIVSKRFSLGERIRYNSLMSLFNGRVDPADAARRFGVLSLLHLWREVPLMAVAGGMRPAGRFLRLTERGRFLSMLMMKEFFSAVSEFREVCRSLSIAKQIAK